MKCLSKSGLDQQSLKSQSHEQLLLSSLQPHPRIIEFLKEYQDDNYSFIVMGFCSSNLFNEAVEGIELHHGARMFDELVLDWVEIGSRSSIYASDRNLSSRFEMRKYSIEYVSTYFTLAENKQIKIADFGLATSLPTSSDWGFHD